MQADSEPKSVGFALPYILQMNQMNFRNDFVTMTAP